MTESALEIRPLTPDRFPDLAALFEEGGDPKWCWCTYFRVRGRDWSNSTAAGNWAELEARRRRRAGRPASSPTGTTGRSAGSAWAPARTSPGWLPRRSWHPSTTPRSGASCASSSSRRARRQGVAGLLLDAAVDYAARPRRDDAGGLPGRHRRREDRLGRTPTTGPCGCSSGPASRSSSAASGTPASPRPTHPSAPRVDTAGTRRVDSRSARNLAARIPPTRTEGLRYDRSLLPPTRRRADPGRRAWEICAHLELDPGGRTAYRTNQEPWANRAPGFFDALPPSEATRTPEPRGPPTHHRRPRPAALVRCPDHVPSPHHLESHRDRNPESRTEERLDGPSGPPPARWPGRPPRRGRQQAVRGRSEEASRSRRSRTSRCASSAATSTGSSDRTARASRRSSASCADC